MDKTLARCYYEQIMHADPDEIIDIILGEKPPITDNSALFQKYCAVLITNHNINIECLAGHCKDKGTCTDQNMYNFISLLSAKEIELCIKYRPSILDWICSSWHYGNSCIIQVAVDNGDKYKIEVLLKAGAKWLLDEEHAHLFYHKARTMTMEEYIKSHS